MVNKIVNPHTKRLEAEGSSSQLSYIKLFKQTFRFFSLNLSSWEWSNMLIEGPA